MSKNTLETIEDKELKPIHGGSDDVPSPLGWPRGTVGTTVGGDPKRNPILGPPRPNCHICGMG